MNSKARCLPIILALFVVACSSVTEESERGPVANPCGEYTGIDAQADQLADRCATAFGERYNVLRQCPAGVVPSECADLTAFSPGVVSRSCDACPSQNVLCCER